MVARVAPSSHLPAKLVHPRPQNLCSTFILLLPSLSGHLS